MESVVPHLPRTSSWTADISDNYCFPVHITPTDLRPDLVWWDDTTRVLCLVELTVCYETNYDEVALRKAAKYEDLAEQARLKGYRTTVLTIQVGSRGIPDLHSIKSMTDMLGMPENKLKQLLRRVMRAALISSFNIWCSRNRKL